MRHHKIIVMFLIFFTCIPAILCARQLTGTDKTWLTENIMKPESSIIFIMKMQRDMLDLDKSAAEENAKDGKPLPDSEKSLKKYILSHKYEAAPYISLYTIVSDEGRHDEGLKILSSGLTNILGRLDKEINNLELAIEAIKIYQAVNEMHKAKTLLEFFVKSNPKNADAIASLAILETITTETGAARSHIDQAYALEPSLLNIYVAEMLYELYKGLIALNNTTDTAGPVSMPISTRFLERAETEHPQLEAPRLARYGLKLFQVFYNAIIRHHDEFKSLQPFKFMLGDQDKNQLRESKAYFEKLLKANKKNDFYIRKCLIIAAILESDLETARNIYEKARFYPSADNDLFRLMCIGEVTQARFQYAAIHITRSIQVKDNIDDRLLLASLYKETGNTEASFQTLTQYKGKINGNLLIGKFGYALMAGKIKEAAEIHQGLKNIPQLIKRPDFRYYSGVLELLQGKRVEAKQTLKALYKKSRYYDNARTILKHFELL